MNKDDPIDLNQERILNQQIVSLVTEEEPSRNLWSGIESRIKGVNSQSGRNNHNTNSWIWWGIAASLVISVGSLGFSWNHLRQAEILYAQMEIQQMSKKDDYKKTLNYQVDLMEQEFKLAKVGLISQISMNQTHIDKLLFSEIQRDLMGINQAAKQLKMAIEKQPDNAEFPKLLRATYQQELSVLTRLAKLDASI